MPWGPARVAGDRSPQEQRLRDIRIADVICRPLRGLEAWALAFPRLEAGGYCLVACYARGDPRFTGRRIPRSPLVRVRIDRTFQVAPYGAHVHLSGRFVRVGSGCSLDHL